MNNCLRVLMPGGLREERSAPIGRIDCLSYLPTFFQLKIPTA